MKKLLYSIILAGVMVLVGLAEPVAGPAESWDEYDLLAKVNILAVHTNQEVLYYESPRGKSYGYLMDVEVTEALRMPPELEPGRIQLLAPVYSIHGDRRLEFHLYSKGEFQVGNQRSVACQYNSRVGTWLVAEWVIDDDVWGRYVVQKENTGTHNGYADDDLARNAASLTIEYIRQRRSGEITWEEYKEKMSPIREYYDRKMDLDELQELP